MSSQMGKRVTVEIFGESHADAIGMTLDGVPAGEPVDMDALLAFMRRRAPGHSALSTARREEDIPEFLCGLRENVTTGAPVTAIIRNKDTRSGDYANLRELPRPSHADYTAYIRYGGKNDIRGGGHFSGRLTAPLCTAGAIALQILSRRGIEIGAHLAKAAGICDVCFDPVNPSAQLHKAAEKPFPVLSDEAGVRMQEKIHAAKAEGDSVGGIIECAVTGMPPGCGNPMFDGVENRLAAALFGIPAVRGVEFGSGFAAADMTGSAHNDPFAYQDGRVVTTTNRSGGIQGGITNGMPIVFRIAIKPTPSIYKEQPTVNLRTGENAVLQINGRHDPCIAVRAVPVTEAVAALCILDILSEVETHGHE